jgi:hypothetical protein
MAFDFNPIGAIVGAVGSVIDDLHTSDEEKIKLAIEEKKIDAEIAKGQIEVNKEEAKSASLFVSGWRPAIGWIGAASLAYQFILYPLLVWAWEALKTGGHVPADMAPPPMLDAEALWILLSGMLGIAGMRSFEKSKGVAAK